MSFVELSHVVRDLTWVILTLQACRTFYELTFNRRNIPNMPTSPAIRRMMIEQLKLDRQMKPNGSLYRIVDLGSGNGQLSWHIARALPGVEVVGLDFSYTGYALSRLRQALLGPRTLSYRRTNFLAYDISNCDAVVMYLGFRMMARIREKLQRELRPGILVLSNTYPLGGDWQPLETIVSKSLLRIDSQLVVYRKVESLNQDNGR